MLQLVSNQRWDLTAFTWVESLIRASTAPPLAKEGGGCDLFCYSQGFGRTLHWSLNPPLKVASSKLEISSTWWQTFTCQVLICLGYDSQGQTHEWLLSLFSTKATFERAWQSVSDWPNFGRSTEGTFQSSYKHRAPFSRGSRCMSHINQLKSKNSIL